MKQQEANKLMSTLLIGLQRARSVDMENLSYNDGRKVSDELTEAIAADLTPWLHGTKGNAFLSGVIKVQDRNVTGMEFYNFMYIIHRLEPTMQAMIGALTETNFPEPDMQWIRGFDS
jgi:hypothetical protein